MRKSIAIISVLPIFALSACGNSNERSEKLPEKFSLCAQISDRDFTATAEMTRLENGWEISMTAPETLEGMQISLTDADCKITYDELSYTAANEDMPANSSIRLTALSLDKCVKAKSSGTVGGADYSFTFKDGKPETLKIGGEIEVSFSNFKT